MSYERPRSSRSSRRSFSRVSPVERAPSRDEVFERRLTEATEKYGPPANPPPVLRAEEDDHFVETDTPRRRVEVSPPRPRLIRRQSSLDTFDLSSRRRRHRDRDADEVPRIAVVPPPTKRYSPPGSEYYDDIGIAEPEYYGDEEYRDFHDREYIQPRQYRDEYEEDSYKQVDERPYPRRGKTRIPKRHANIGAIIEIGYPYQEEVFFFFFFFRLFI